MSKQQIVCFAMILLTQYSSVTKLAGVKMVLQI